MKDLGHVDRQFRRQLEEADLEAASGDWIFLKQLCSAGLAVESVEGKLAVYAPTHAAREGSESLKSFVKMAAWRVQEERIQVGPPRVNCGCSGRAGAERTKWAPDDRD